MTLIEQSRHDQALTSSPSWWRRQAEDLRDTMAYLQAMGREWSHVEQMVRNAEYQARINTH